MNPLILGVLGGIGFGVIDVLLMLPLQFPDRRTAFTAAFLIPLTKLPLPGPLAGALIGLLISLPDAVITKAYVPIIATGIVGGAILGWISARYVA